MVMPGQPKHAATYTATIIHTGIANPPEIRIVGTLRQVKVGALASFTKSYKLASGEIVILGETGN